MSDVPGQRPRGGGTSSRTEQSFLEILANELKHTPWLALSLLLHGIVFLTFSVFARIQPLVPDLLLSVKSDPPADEAGIDDEKPPEPQPDTANEQSPEPPSTDALEPTETTASPKAPEDDPAGDPFASSLLPWNERGLLAKVGGRRSGAGGNGLDLLGEGLKGGEDFRKTVGKLRKTGLELVFVVDSTASMHAVLEGAKRRIVSMLDVLHVLVPDARIGVLTYRDTGKDEAYLFRQIPLSRDHYRAASFVQTLTAQGGGERDEAVYEALLETLRMRWSSGAQRAIVLVGDAPPHATTEGSTLARLRSFANDGRSHVHAIITSEDGANRLPKDTLAAFQKITKAGAGICLGFEDEDRLLKQVLSLAFGHEYRRDLEEIYKIVEERNRKISTYALDVARSADLSAVDAALKKEPVDAEIVKALVASPRSELAEHLIEVASTSTMPEPGRQAAAWALQQMLQMTYPPLDPERGGVLNAAERRALTQLVRERLR